MYENSKLKLPTIQILTPDLWVCTNERYDVVFVLLSLQHHHLEILIICSQDHSPPVADCPICTSQSQVDPQFSSAKSYEVEKWDWVNNCFERASGWDLATEDVSGLEISGKTS